MTLTAVVCPAGSYRSTVNVCETCEFNFYQPNRGQTSCMSCTEGQVTMSHNSTSLEDCVGM